MTRIAETDKIRKYLRINVKNVDILAFPWCLFALLTLVLALASTVSCAPHPHPNPNPVPVTTSSTTPTPIKVNVNPIRVQRIKNVEEHPDLFEGDIILSDDQERAINIASAARVALSGIVGEKYRWDEKLVHYEISSDYAPDERELIESAMEELAEKTCIKFQERDGEDDFIKIEDGDGCSSKVGKRGGEQTVTLSKNGCMKHGVAIHEIVHALGFWHEQSRTDRDTYVDIIWKNIQPGKYNNFKKYLRAEIYDYQVPYDYNSVMHYKADAFKRDDTDEDTIVPKDAKAEIGQREGLSELDARKINLMYCPELVKNGTYTPLGSTEEGSGEEGEEGEGEGDNEGDEDTSREDSLNGNSNANENANLKTKGKTKNNKNKIKKQNQNESRSSINLIPAIKRKPIGVISKTTKQEKIIQNKIQSSLSTVHAVSSFISLSRENSNEDED